MTPKKRALRQDRWRKRGGWEGGKKKTYTHWCTRMYTCMHACIYTLSLSHTHTKRARYQEKALTGHVLVKARPTHLMATSSLGDPEPMLKFAAMGPVTSLGGLEPKPPSCVPVKEPRRPGLSKTQLSWTLLCSFSTFSVFFAFCAHANSMLCSFSTFFVFFAFCAYANSVLR